MSGKESLEHIINTTDKRLSKEKLESQIEDPSIKLEEAQDMVDATIAKEQEKTGIKETFWSKYKWWMIWAGTLGLWAWLLKPWKWFSKDDNNKKETESQKTEETIKDDENENHNTNENNWITKDQEITTNIEEKVTNAIKNWADKLTEKVEEKVNSWFSWLLSKIFG